MAGEALWYPGGDPHHHVLRNTGDAGAQRGAVVCLAGHVCPGLLIFGGSFGAAEVAINVEGAAVEREMNKTVLPMMHGFYSLGTLAGAGVGMALTASGVSANLHILLAALISVVPVLTGIRAIPDGTGKTPLMNTKRRKRAAVLP